MPIASVTGRRVNLDGVKIVGYAPEFPPGDLDKVSDQVHLPKHYARFEIEPIRFIVENFGPTWIVGNIIKYIMRYDAKNGPEDIKKAKRYLDMLEKYNAGDKDWWK